MGAGLGAGLPGEDVVWGAGGGSPAEAAGERARLLSMGTSDFFRGGVMRGWGMGKPYVLSSLGWRLWGLGSWVDEGGR